MNLELGVAVGLSLSLATLAAELGRRLGNSCRALVRRLLIAGFLLACLAWLHLLHDTVLLAELFPLSQALYFGKFFVAFAGLSCGLLLAEPTVAWWRRAVLAGGLWLAAAWVAWAGLLGPAPACFERWRDGVCLQTTHQTCGPAAAATALHTLAVPASEAELASLCLSTTAGTQFLGVYRGLHIKLRETPWQVEAFSGDAASLHDPGPLVLEVMLPSDGSADPRYERDWGWLPGVPHLVVLFGFAADGRPLMGEPTVGREHWSLIGLQSLWTGRGFRFQRRES